MKLYFSFFLCRGKSIKLFRSYLKSVIVKKIQIQNKYRKIVLLKHAPELQRLIYIVQFLHLFNLKNVEVSSLNLIVKFFLKIKYFKVSHHEKTTEENKPRRRKLSHNLFYSRKKATQASLKRAEFILQKRKWLRKLGVLA